MTTVDWTFGGEWPFEPKWFDTPEGKLHYIDEGPRDAPPIVMVHGNPTWSYLYRRFIRAAIDTGYRAIAMDHLGFGRSDKPSSEAVYSIADHADRCETLLKSLDITNAIMVVQDWGGPIGLTFAARNPERVAGLFVLNTFFTRPLKKVPLPLIIRAFRAPILGDLIVRGAHAFVRGFLFKGGLADPSRLSDTDKAAYLAPHPNWSSRTGVLAFPRQIPDGPEGEVSDFVAIEGAKLAQAFAGKPVKIVWPMKDVAFSIETLDGMWLRDFPNADVVRVKNAGHYIQEDAPETVIPHLLAFAHLATGRAG